jgi:hypothetical protein
VLPSVPHRAAGSCPDPEILGTGSREVSGRGAAQAKPDLVQPDVEKGGGRDPTAKDET